MLVLYLKEEKVKQKVLINEYNEEGERMQRLTRN